MKIKSLLNLDRPLVIAHRGFSQAAPENTAASFRLALKASPDLIELDYYHSAEGVPVVFHDRTTDRTTNARELWGEEQVPVSEKSWMVLQQLDAGSWFDPQFAGTGLLLLEEALDLIQSASVTLIERKEGDPKTLHQLLMRKNLLDDVMVQSFDWDFLSGFHALAPQVPLGALGPPQIWEGVRLSAPERALSEIWLNRLAKTGASMVVWNTQIDGKAVEAAAKRGLKVWTYVINDIPAADGMLEAGASGLIGDNPAILWKALAVGNKQLSDRSDKKAI